MEQILIRTAKYIFTIFLALLSFSCVTTQTLTIEVPQKAEKDLPESIQSLTLINRTVDEKYQDYNIDSLQNIFYRKQFNLDTLIYDLSAVDTTLIALGELLYESGRYDFVIPVDRFIDFQKNSFLSYEMPWNEVKELCERYNTDAVLSIDYYKTRVETNLNRETFYNPVNDDYVDALLAQMKVLVEVMIRIYDPATETVLFRDIQRDTLIWENADINTRDLFKNFTPVKQALAEAGIAMALDFSEKISTNWRQEQRKFYIKGDKNFQQAADLAMNNQWDQAIALWKQTVENTKQKTVKSKAEYNIAVAYEILGEIDQAVSWALKSYETMYRQITYEYLDLLQKRKNELKNN